jgi:hypothetical protein
VSQTLIKRTEGLTHEVRSQPGFHAELPGWDLPTLLQMSCARGERVCVEVRCAHDRGHIYMAEGRLVHASVGTVIGEAAVALMLEWPGGNFALCDRPWPPKASIDASADAVLVRAAQAQDESARAAGLAQLAAAQAELLDPPPSVAFDGLLAGQSAPFDEPQPWPESSTSASEPTTPAQPAHATRGAGPVIASVRIDMNGDVVAQNGRADVLASLVAYVTRMGALLGPQLGLEPFEALAAELGKRRALVFVEADHMVGLLLPQGTLCQELRQQLGV